MNSSMMIATSGEPRICTTAAWLRPSSAMTMTMTAMVSGTLATDGQALVPEMPGAGVGRAEAADAAERRAHAMWRVSLIAVPPMTR